MRVIPRSETLLPQHPGSYYPGPFEKIGVVFHHMGAHEEGAISLNRALQINRVNHDYHLARWGSIDIMEGFDLFNVAGEPVLVTGRPWWSNCDAFSGMAKIGYKWIGVEVCGNYQDNPPSDVLIEGCVQTLQLFKMMEWVPAFMAEGHRSFNHLSNYGPSECPGTYFYALIPGIQAEAERRYLKGAEEEMGKIYIAPNQYAVKKSDGTLIYNVPGCHPSWWFDTSNEHAETVQITLFANPYNKVQDGDVRILTDGVRPTKDQLPGIHAQFASMAWAGGAPPSFFELSIHAPKPMAFLIGP